MNEFGKRAPTRREIRTYQKSSSPTSRRMISISLGGAAVLGVCSIVFGLTERSNHVAATASSDAPAYPRSLSPTTDKSAVGDVYPTGDEKVECRHRYPIDHSMRATCLRVQEEARWAAMNMQIDDDVGRLCSGRHKNSWSLYLTCVKSQLEAKHRPSELQDRPKFDIVTKCEKEWPADFSMREHCIRRQEAARDKALGMRHRVDDAIATKCALTWRHDWNMYDYCMTQQMQAKGRL